MKKVFYIFVLTLFVFTITGCGGKKEEVMNCSITLDDDSRTYTYNTQYKVTYVGDIVKKSELVETITSESDEAIDYFETYLNTYYTSYKETYGGVTWNITKSSGKLVSNTAMDYTKMDMGKLASDDAAFKTYLNEKNELTLEGLKAMYKSTGITCE